jgi:hypothetical protein
VTIKLVGLLVVLLAALLLFILGFVFKRRTFYQPRRFRALEALERQRTAAIEKGFLRHIVLGQRLGSRVTPGLGLSALSILPSLSGPEALGDGGQRVSAGGSVLYLLARQVLEGSYRGGISPELTPAEGAILPGLTPLAYTAGLLPHLRGKPHGSLVLLGIYGPESALWADGVMETGGKVFAAAGTLTAQAALFLHVREILLGEEVYAVPAALQPEPFNLAALQTEDVLRVLLILTLLVGIVLKLLRIL